MSDLAVLLVCFAAVAIALFLYGPDDRCEQCGTKLEDHHGTGYLYCPKCEDVR